MYGPEKQNGDCPWGCGHWKAQQGGLEVQVRYAGTLKSASGSDVFSLCRFVECTLLVQVPF